MQAGHHPPAKTLIARKRAEGKSWREALRCLKRHLARRVYRLMQPSALVVEVAAKQVRSLQIDAASERERAWVGEWERSVAS